MLPTISTAAIVLRGPYPERLTEEEFLQFCEQNHPLRIERTAHREIIIMAAAGSRTGKRNARLTLELGEWWKKNQELGEVFDSNAGFTLPSGAMRSPDACWVSAGKWQALTEKEKDGFAPLCPEFVVELKSLTDSRQTLLDKMDEYRQNGALLGWLLVPETATSYIFRAGETGYETVVGFEQELAGEAILPGFRLDLRVLQ
jgi:Uma2 family endonuclease